MQKINSKSTMILTLSAALVLSACGDDDENMMTMADAGTAQTPDRVIYVPPDAGHTAVTDSGVVSTPHDAGHYCAPNTGIVIEGQDVDVDEAASTINTNAAVNCIDEPPPLDIAGSITIRACIQLLGTSTTALTSELDALEIAVFYHSKGGIVVNPTFSATTGADREPGSRVNTDIISGGTACPSGIQFDIGHASAGNTTVKAAVDYTIRLRSKTSTGAYDPNGPWATTYHHRIKVFADRIQGGGASPSNCTPETCTGIVNLFAVRKTQLQSFVSTASVTISGGDVLGDGIGEGHALISTTDCQLTPMTGAVAGFVPTPQDFSYVINGAFDNSAQATDQSGLYFGLGFGTNTEARAAVGIMRNANTCTEQFAGDKFRIYPDAITVFASSPANTLNQN